MSYSQGSSDSVDAFSVLLVLLFIVLAVFVIWVLWELVFPSKTSRKSQDQFYEDADKVKNKKTSKSPSGTKKTDQGKQQNGSPSPGKQDVIAGLNQQIYQLKIEKGTLSEQMDQLTAEKISLKEANYQLTLKNQKLWNDYDGICAENQRLQSYINHLQERLAVQQRSTISLAAHGASQAQSSPIDQPPAASTGELPLQQRSERLPARTVLYAHIPEQDGTFKRSELKTAADWDSLYSLELDGERTASLTLNPNRDRFAAALQSPHVYLEPACRFDRNPGPNASSIEVVEPGRAEFEDQVWKIKQKITIAFS